jgi:predicted 2-oxoglutarate/Fe(II)-dependent dioxygenase YbiX
MNTKKELDIIYYEDTLFTSYECEKLIKLSQKTGEFYNSAEEKIPGVLYHKYTVKNTENTNWIFERLTNHFITKTNLCLRKVPDEFFINKYEKNCSFALHNDGYDFKRIWSLVVQLSDDYTGGDLNLYLDKKIKIKKNIGNCVMFRPEIFHEVTKITKGTRWSLILFLENENICDDYNKKTLF